jgi:uncharacterized membrane protein
MLIALIGAVVLGVLSTFYDFLWAHFEVRHKVVNGLVHGVTLLSVAGLVLAYPTRRWLAGLLGGALAGLMGAASFYGAYPLLGYLNALIGAWVVMWMAFSTLAAQLQSERVGKEAGVRGLAAAALSGVAFYLVSGMWTDHSADPNYLRHVAYWAFAFFPGFAALLFKKPTPRSASGD